MSNDKINYVPHSPSFVTGFQSRVHRVDIANRFKGIVHSTISQLSQKKLKKEEIKTQEEIPPQ